MKTKVILINNNDAWNAKKRYKVNEGVFYNGSIYQNTTGKNSIPEDLIDWINISPASGGVGSGDLQSVLDSGRSWIDTSDPDYTKSASFGDFENLGSDGFLWQGKENSFAVDPLGFTFFSGKQEDSGTVPTVPRIKFRGAVPLENGVLTFNLPNDKPFNNAGGDGEFTGEYDIATTSDFKTINGESIVGSGDIVISGGGGSQDLEAVLAEGNETTNDIVFKEGAGLSFLGDTSVEYMSIYTSPETVESIERYRASITMRSTTDESAGRASVKITVNPNQPDGGEIGEGTATIGNLYLPLFLESETRTVATVEDLAIDNSTTVALSAATLNSTYPNAVNGFRVHCLSITLGGMIYERTGSGWISQTATVVV